MHMYSKEANYEIPLVFEQAWHVVIMRMYMYVLLCVHAL